MAITAYTGPPGAGKSHALVKDVILRAVFAGRRVCSNVDGLNPNAIRAYCLEREELWLVDHADKLGEVVLFHGEDAKAASGFWPTEATEKAGEVCFIRPGDLVVFDEWAMFFPGGERSPAVEQCEQFMRWHRHMTAEDGTATDLAIATQSISDFHRRHRPLLSRSYLFKKLSAVGAENSYTWHVFDGRFQRHSYQTGTASYDRAIFPLYKSSAAASSGNHTELRTDKRSTIWSGWKPKAFVAAMAICAIGGPWGVYSVYASQTAPSGPKVAGGAPDPVSGAPGAISVPAVPPPSPWRIVGHIQAEEGTKVIIADKDGSVRMMDPGAFSFTAGRPMSGVVDGRTVYVNDGLALATSPSFLPGAIQ